MAELRQAGSLCFWVIFATPSDFPDHIVMRRQYADFPGGVRHHPIACLYDNIDQARRDVPCGLHCLPRSPADDPVIIESWL